MLKLKLRNKYRNQMNHLAGRFGWRCKGFYIALRLRRERQGMK